MIVARPSASHAFRVSIALPVVFLLFFLSWVASLFFFCGGWPGRDGFAAGGLQDVFPGARVSMIPVSRIHGFDVSLREARDSSAH